MDDAVGRFNVRGHKIDLGEIKILAGGGADPAIFIGGDIGGHHRATGHVILHNARQVAGRIGHERGQLLLIQRFEGGVGRGKKGARSFGRRFSQPGGGEGLDQRTEVRIGSQQFGHSHAGVAHQTHFLFHSRLFSRLGSGFFGRFLHGFLGRFLHRLLGRLRHGFLWRFGGGGLLRRLRRAAAAGDQRKGAQQQHNNKQIPLGVFHHSPRIKS